MSKMGWLYLFLVFTLSYFIQAVAFAQESVWVEDLGQFERISIDELNNQNIVFNKSLVPFQQWAQERPFEKELLSLYPNYQEPTVSYMKDGIIKTREETLMVFVVRSKTVINKRPEDLNLGLFTTLGGIKTLDKELQHFEITPDRFMANAVATNSAKDNFAGCKEAKPEEMSDKDYDALPGTLVASGRLKRPQREVDLSWTMSPIRQWCDNSNNSICVESCFPFTRLWKQGVQVVNLGMDADEKKDTAAAMQWEVRHLTQESELGSSQALSALTGLNTEVTGLIEINMFYFNQIMHFGKSLAIFQRHPNDPDKTVMNVYLAIAVKKRTYETHAIVGEVLRGDSYLNTDSGVTSGLPIFLRQLAASIATSLEE